MNELRKDLEVERQLNDESACVIEQLQSKFNQTRQERVVRQEVEHSMNQAVTSEPMKAHSDGKKNTTPQQMKMEWKETDDEERTGEGIEIQMNGMTPKATNLNNINSMGAEDVNESSSADLSDFVSNIPLKAILKRTPDSSCKTLLSTPTFTTSTNTEKENHQQEQQIVIMPEECSFCFRPPRVGGAIKQCQCGKDTCNKWAHATCLTNRKSISSCVSHPGTPAPPMPTILCDGIWCKEI